MPDSHSPIQPVFVICGMIMAQNHVINLTHDFLNMKRRFYPSQFSRIDYLDGIKEEIKGADLRKAIRSSRNHRRHAFGLIDESIKLVEKFNAVLLGRVWVKPIGQRFDGRSVYTYSMQDIARGFQAYLASKNETGIIIADSRNKAKNAIVSHSIFTQKYKPAGDAYDRIVEMPVYGHSDNHAGLQLTDFLTSAVIFPISTSVYCAGHVINTTHHHPQFLNVRAKFGNRLSQLQYRYSDTSGRYRGGITVSDPIAYRSGGKLFNP